MLIWIDFTCPFCYVGMKRLLPLLEKEDLDVEIKSFLLNPDLKGVNDYIKSLSEKYGVSYEKAENMTYGATKLAQEDDIEIDFKKLREINTINVHKVIKYFKDSHKFFELVLKIYDTYFLEHKNISNLNVLEDILKELDLDSSNLKEILKDDTYLDEINKDMYQASTFKIQSIPSIVLKNGKTYMGSRTLEGYKEIIENAKEIEL